MPAKVLILSWEYPPVVEGGLARHVGKLAQALAVEGVEVDVVTRGRREDDRAGADPGGPDDAGARDGAVRVHRVPEPRWPRDLDRFLAWVEHMNEDLLARALELARHDRFGLVHGHDWLVARCATELADRLGVPYLTTVHATEHGRHQGWVDKPPQSTIHAVERAMLGRADGVIACSHYMRDHLTDVFAVDPERIEVIPNGIDPRDLRVREGDLTALRRRFAADEEQLVLLVGRLVYEKGFQLALEALPRVIRRVGGVRYLIAGSGPHEAELRQQARQRGLDGHGHFLGWMGDDALHPLYRIADVCVVPSIYEPFGLVALEAMASGCPCLVADTGGLREVVPEGRVLMRFRARDPLALAGRLERLLVDEALRRRLVAEASEHVVRFDWSEVAAATARRYATLIRVRSGSLV